jgi:hypothetical protein
MSHDHRDKPFVRELATYLQKYGITVWVDEAEIGIGESLLNKVARGIAENAFVGVVLSRNSVASQWVAHELRLAMDRELREKRALVLPIVLDEAERPAFLADKLYADFSNPAKYFGELARLLTALGAAQKPGPRVYISYTHDSEAHKAWVARLAQRLALDGANVTYDYAFMEPGVDFWDSISNELARAGAIVLVCSVTYKRKAEGEIPGGLKREFDQIVQQAAARPSLKVIPIVRGKPWSRTLPAVFSGRFGVDMGGDPDDEEAYRQLLAIIRKPA